MRIAVIDMLFSWPPHGGADVDLWHMVNGLAKLGHDLHVWGVKYDDSWERGAFKPENLPFPATRLDFSAIEFTPDNVTRRICREIDAFCPDVVFVGDGFFFKPYVIRALNKYPLISRYYAYEFACQKDILHFRDGKACDKEYLLSPDFCRACAFDALKPGIRRGSQLAWTVEYVAARAYSPEFYEIYLQSCSGINAAVVYNSRMAAQIKDYCPNVHIVPGGVDIQLFEAAPPPNLDAQGRKVIFMSGRAEDPAKGLQTLLEAGRILSNKRKDFVIQATLPEDLAQNEWFESLAWRPHAETIALYRAAHICVVPSIWEEPFGLVALEAMACARPVVVSKVGGLRESVLDGECGLHFKAGDAGELAMCLERLLDDDALCLAFGSNGRARVEKHYSWEHIVREHYARIFEGV